MYPKLIKPYVLSFCSGICQNKPVWVQMRPLPERPKNECFSILPEHIMVNGGKQHNGWAIWEWPKVLIEAEFHCIWESPGGDFLDLTPKGFPLDKILFLPDSKKQYRGVQVDNIRKPLSRDKDVLRFIELAGNRFAELNRTVLPDYYGKITIQGRALAIQDEMERLEDRLRSRFGTPGATA